MSEGTQAAEAGHALAAEAGGPPVVARLTGLTALEAKGPDAVDFLNGQLTADVRGLGNGATTRSLLLNHKGQAMAEAQVLRLAADHVVLVVDDGRGDWVRETLERHIVFDEVTMTTAPCAALSVQGARAPEVVPALGAPVPAQDELAELEGPAYVYGVARSGSGGLDVAFLGAGAPARAGAALGALEAAGAISVSEAALDTARVVALVSAAGREGGDGVLPQEAGLERFVSFRKGCYLGQEIMARIEARGAVRRSLARLALSDEPTATEVRQGGRVVGRLGTVARLPHGEVGALAALRNDVQDDAELQVGEGVTARVVARARMMPA